MAVRSWRKSAREAGIDFRCLPPALQEILDLLHRVVVRGMPWPNRNARDPMLGTRKSLPLLPALLAKRARQRPNHADRQGRSEVSFRRAINLGVQLGLLRIPVRRRGRALQVTPAWATDPSVWVKAAGILDDRPLTVPCATDDHSRARTGVSSNSFANQDDAGVRDHPSERTSLRLNVLTKGIEAGVGSSLAPLAPEPAYAPLQFSQNIEEGRDPRRPLPLSDPEEADAAAELLRRVGHAQEWRVEETLRPMLLHFDAEGIVGGVLEVIEREVLPRWEAGEIKQPIAYLRKILRDSGDQDDSPYGVFLGDIDREPTEGPSQVASPPALDLSARSEFEKPIERSPESERGRQVDSIVRDAVERPNEAPQPAVPDPETARQLQEQASADREAAERNAEWKRAQEEAQQARREKEGFRNGCYEVLCGLEELARGHPERVRAIRAIVYPTGPGEAVYDATTADRLHALAETYRASQVSGPPPKGRGKEIGADVACKPS